MRITLTALALLAATAVGRAQDDDFERELRSELARLKQSALYLRMRGMQGLARTADPEALRVLQKRYDRPRTPKDFERYLIAGFIGEYFADSEHVAALRKWAPRHRHDADAWLLFNATLGAAGEDDVAELGAVVMDRRASPLQRAATLEALAARGHPDGLALVARLDRAPPPLAESAAASLWAHRRVRKSPEFAVAARKVIGWLELEEVEARTKLVIVRYLARLFEAQRLSLRAEDWRRQLDYDEMRKTEAGGGPTVGGRPTFFGIEASGDRIAYVIDLSDSMATPLSVESLKQAKRAVTGKPGATDPIPWKGIRTRLDLARAYLERSLKQLKPEMSYVVIGFGTKARPLHSTPGMVSAAPAKVAATIAELRALRPSGKSRKRPHGTLWGNTNAHAGLLLAFRARSGGFARGQAHVDRATFRSGCDTLYLLSDGVPTNDDFPGTGPHEGQPLTDDLESGSIYYGNPPSVTHQGPYRIVRHLMRDVQRLNLFRKVELHCIAIGEAHSGMLQGIAELGLGRFVFFG